jgi:hypothetical protein
MSDREIDIAIRLGNEDDMFESNDPRSMILVPPGEFERDAFLTEASDLEEYLSLRQQLEQMINDIISQGEVVRQRFDRLFDYMLEIDNFDNRRIYAYILYLQYGTIRTLPLLISKWGAMKLGFRLVNERWERERLRRMSQRPTRPSVRPGGRKGIGEKVSFEYLY